MDFIGSGLDRMDDLLVEDSEQDDDSEEHSSYRIHIPCAAVIPASQTL